MTCPCKDCENKGCGSFHDECKPYQNYLVIRKQQEEYRKSKAFEAYRNQKIKREI